MDAVLLVEGGGLHALVLQAGQEAAVQRGPRSSATVPTALPPAAPSTCLRAGACKTISQSELTQMQGSNANVADASSCRRRNAVVM